MYGLIDDGAPVFGEYGIYGDYVYPEEYGLGDESFFDEQWAPIDASGDYMVSTHGRVWSTKSQQFVKPKPMDKHGHLGICIYHGGGHKPTYHYIHRLMAEAFIDNCKNDPIVRHLNDDPRCNVLENLAWGTMKDNARDSIENGNAYFLTDEDRRKGNLPRMIPVRAHNIKTGKCTDYESLYDACRALGLQQSNAWKVLHGQRRHTGGYTFEALEKDISDE